MKAKIALEVMTRKLSCLDAANRVPMQGGGTTRKGEEAFVMKVEQRGCIIQPSLADLLPLNQTVKDRFGLSVFNSFNKRVSVTMENVSVIMKGKIS
ncbi:hypothetical protein [Puia dinghuensis]|uniref:Uncharacterized protein n=1 Tax=Puia dinghuensis TaxID=1792502 RepID=A0A8J2UIR2_9BACT|nr:hypothetical protein [Puia dinghuensis]GGB24044.1 hypothetical protein GCM10011511_54940 [Puia dinghuensis]